MRDRKLLNDTFKLIRDELNRDTGKIIFKTTLDKLKSEESKEVLRTFYRKIVRGDVT